MISINDRLPFDGEIVFAYNEKYDEIWLTQYDDYYGAFFDLEDYKPLLVTHWGITNVRD